MPDWQFEEVVSVPEFMDFARGWRARGVRMIGGCYGLSVGHIAALQALDWR